MIIPHYSHGSPSIPEVKDKCYCSYWENLDGINYARYLHPDGWKRYTHYFNTLREAEHVFQKYNQSPLPIEQFEIDQQIEDQKYFDEMQDQSFHEYMDALLDQMHEIQMERMHERQHEIQMESSSRYAY